MIAHPYTAEDQQGGYHYDLSILHAEFPLTQILDRPLTTQLLFKEVIRENLGLGLPDMVQLIFDRRVSKKTPRRSNPRADRLCNQPALRQVGFQANRRLLEV